MIKYLCQAQVDVVDVSGAHETENINKAGDNNTTVNIVKPSVTFHTVLDRPADRHSAHTAHTDKKPSDNSASSGNKYKKSGQSWRNIFHIGSPLTRSSGSRHHPPAQHHSHVEFRGSHREINIDEAILPENKPLNYRPRPRSEINLSYSIQVRDEVMITILTTNAG